MKVDLLVPRQLLVLVSDSNGDNHEGYGVDAYMIVVMAKKGGGVIDARVGDDGQGWWYWLWGGNGNSIGDGGINIDS